MNDEITLRISLSDLGQIADGLEARLSTWRNTLKMMESAYTASFDVEECTDAEEAAGMVAEYERLTHFLWEQINKHRRSGD